MTSAVEFLSHIDDPKMTALQRAQAILWWHSQSSSTGGLSAAEICEIIEACGHPQQNASRLNLQLKSDRWIVKARGKNAWRLGLTGKRALDAKYGSVVTAPKKPKPTDSVLPRTLFENTRGYLEKVVFQINASYDNALYDCCAVMCRRLLETLIIETYEIHKRADEIKGRDGHFFMFADLLRVLESDSLFNVSRNGRTGLNDFKRLGDLSAHNRRFNAGKPDIDRIRDGLRVAAEELLHLAKLI